MTRHHIIISGTGRAGTTFLIQLLTELGLDTGFPKGLTLDLNSRAGMELDIRDPHAPYVIKSPWLCDYLDDVLQGGGVIVDHAFVPMRDLFSAAQSRRYVTNKAGPDAINVPGGLVHTTEPEQQEKILEEQLYKLIYALAKHDVPLSLLSYPQLVIDPDYLYKKIRHLLGDLEYGFFLTTFKALSHPELVHDFTSLNDGPDNNVNIK